MYIYQVRADQLSLSDAVTCSAESLKVPFALPDGLSK